MDELKETYDNKVSALTGVPVGCITKLNDYLDLIHGDDISQTKSDSVFDVEIFEGHIYIKVENDEVRYKFVPNEQFNKVVRSAIISKESPLIKALNAKVVKALSNIYQNLT